MPKKEYLNPDQFSLAFSVPAPLTDDVSDADEIGTSDLPLIHDPETVLAELHYVMSKRPTPYSDLVDGDIQYEVNRIMKRLYDIWGVPTDRERREALETSLDETIAFLQSLPFRDTTAMGYLESHDLTSIDIQDLREALAGQFETFTDLNSSDGYRRHGTVAAFFRNQVTEPKTPKKFRK